MMMTNVLQLATVRIRIEKEYANWNYIYLHIIYAYMSKHISCLYYSWRLADKRPFSIENWCIFRLFCLRISFWFYLTLLQFIWQQVFGKFIQNTHTSAYLINSHRRVTRNACRLSDVRWRRWNRWIDSDPPLSLVSSRYFVDILLYCICLELYFIYLRTQQRY